MKQFRTFLALLCTIVCSQTILADEVVVDGIKYSLVDSTKQATVVSNNYKGDVVIPQSVTYNGADYAVVALGESCFKGCQDTINITIPEGVVSIGDNCFFNSANMAQFKSSVGGFDCQLTKYGAQTEHKERYV